MDIAGFDVQVQQIARMDQVQGIQDRWEDGHDETGAEIAAPFLDVAGQILASLVIHHQIAGIVFPKESPYLDDIGVAQGGEYLYFLVEQAQTAMEIIRMFGFDDFHPVVLAPAGQFLGQELLDDDFVLGILVLGQVDQAETTARDQLHDHVTVDHGIRRQAVAMIFHSYR